EARKPRFIRTVHGFGYAFVGQRRDAAAPSVADAGATLLFRGREFPLRDGENVLGRDLTADVQIDDATVSRRHAAVTVGDEVTLHDLDSKNGTFVGGTRLSAPQVLTDGDTFVLGDAAIV